MTPNLRDTAFLGALVYFERAASRLSFADAAVDLGITPSAISHRIAVLESALGQRLFERRVRQVSLTPEGRALAQVAQRSFAQLREATEAIVSSQVLRVSVGAYLSANWLMPRLNRFENDHPGVRIDLLHRAGWPNLRDIDIAIVWYDKPPADTNAEPLFDALCVPVSAPGVLGNSEIWQCGLPALHYRDRTIWHQWLAAAGGPKDYASTGEIFDDPNLVLEAAAHQRGIAMGFLPFIKPQLASGRLQCAHTYKFHSPWRYWLVKPGSHKPHISALISWLQNEAAQTSLTARHG